MPIRRPERACPALRTGSRARVPIAAGLALLALLPAGCARLWLHPPPGAVPSQREAQSHEDGRGAWTLVEYRAEGRKAHAEGELIAIDAQNVLLLAGGRMVTVPRVAVSLVTLVPFYWASGSLELQRVPAGKWELVLPYARFPQGLPPSFDPGAAHPEPPTR